MRGGGKKNKPSTIIIFSLAARLLLLLQIQAAPSSDDGTAPPPPPPLGLRADLAPDDEQLRRDLALIFCSRPCDDDLFRPRRSGLASLAGPESTGCRLCRVGCGVVPCHILQPVDHDYTRSTECPIHATERDYCGRVPVHCWAETPPVVCHSGIWTVRRRPPATDGSRIACSPDQFELPLYERNDLGVERWAVRACGIEFHKVHEKCVLQCEPHRPGNGSAEAAGYTCTDELDPGFVLASGGQKHVSIVAPKGAWNNPFEATQRGSLAELVGFDGGHFRTSVSSLAAVLDTFDGLLEQEYHDEFNERDLMARLAGALLEPRDRSAVCRRICPEAPVAVPRDPPPLRRPPVSRFAEDAGVKAGCVGE